MALDQTALACLVPPVFMFDSILLFRYVLCLVPGMLHQAFNPANAHAFAAAQHVRKVASRGIWVPLIITCPVRVRTGRAHHGTLASGLKSLVSSLYMAHFRSLYGSLRLFTAQQSSVEACGQATNAAVAHDGFASPSIQVVTPSQVQVPALQPLKSTPHTGDRRRCRPIV